LEPSGFFNVACIGRVSFRFILMVIANLSPPICENKKKTPQNEMSL
jgi:hypothetical protein